MAKFIRFELAAHFLFDHFYDIIQYTMNKRTRPALGYTYFLHFCFTISRGHCFLAFHENYFAQKIISWKS